LLPPIQAQTGGKEGSSTTLENEKKKTFKREKIEVLLGGLPCLSGKRLRETGLKMMANIQSKFSNRFEPKKEKAEGKERKSAAVGWCLTVPRATLRKCMHRQLANTRRRIAASQ